MKKNYVLPLCLLAFAGTNVFNDNNPQQTINHITYTDSLKFLSNPGPRNDDLAKYAYLYIIRPPKTAGQNNWYGLMNDKDWFVKVIDNCRIIQKIPKEGKFSVWGEGNGITAIDLDLKFGHSYFIRFDVTESQPANTLKLIQLDSIQGMEEFDKITGKEYRFDYPQLVNLSTALPKREYSPNFIRNLQDSMTFGTLTFLPPVSTRFYYIIPNEGFRFCYFNKFLSPTFSEIDIISAAESKNFDSKEDLLDFVKKQTRNGKAIANGKDKLIRLDYESLEGGSSDLAYAIIDEVEDRNTPVKGDAPFLLLREYTIYTYKNTGGKKGIMCTIRFSERGMPDEVHHIEEMRFKAKLVLNSFVYH